MKRNRIRIPFQTTKHMYHKMFLLSQKLGLLRGAPVSIPKIAKDAIIEHWDLDNSVKWKKIEKLLNNTLVTASDLLKNKG